MSDAAAGTPSLESAPAVGLSPFKASWRRYSRNKLAFGSMIILLLIVLACFGGPLLFPFGPEDADFENIAAPIDLFSLHPFGTDEFGRDLLLRVLVGGRVSLAVGFVGAIAAVIIGVLYGATAGYVGGRLDNFLMRTVDVLYGIPYFFLVVLINLWSGRTVAGPVRLDRRGPVADAGGDRARPGGVAAPSGIRRCRAGGRHDGMADHPPAYRAELAQRRDRLFQPAGAGGHRHRIVPQLPRPRRPGAGDLLGIADRGRRLAIWRPICACCCCRAASWSPPCSASTS